MRNQLSTARVTFWVSRVILAIVVLLLPGLPFLLDWYCSLRPLPALVYRAILIAFYCCSVFVLLALWKMGTLMQNILAGEIFVTANTRCIRWIQWCCGAISLICLPAAFFYPPLWFMVIIMAFLCLTVCVVAQVIDAAVAIREENDLTI